MKKILLKDYDISMGQFIDVNYINKNIVSNGIHYTYEDLLLNHNEYLDKNKKYFIYCDGGVKSKKVVSILEFYGYDVTLVYKE